MNKLFILLAWLSVLLVGCNVKIEPTSTNQVSKNGDSTGVAQNQQGNNSGKPKNSDKTIEEKKGEHLNKDFKSHYIELDKLECQPVDPERTGVRMVEDKCPAYSTEGQDYWVRREWFEGNKLFENTSESGRIWTVEILGEDNRIPMIPKNACPDAGNKMVGISFGKKMEFLLWREKPFAAVFRVKCHVEPEGWDGGMDPQRVSEQEWKAVGEKLVVRGIDLTDTIQAFDVDVKDTQNANNVVRERAEKDYLEMIEKGQ